ncbi:MAG: glycosyltransferase [Candidatus Bathyarchaeia archaeon]
MRLMWHPTFPQLILCSALALTLTILCSFGLNNIILLYFRASPAKRRLIAEEAAHISEWPFVTIQVATYNEGDTVTRLLDSCLKLDYPADKFEIIVVDDSTDETIQILREYERRYYPRIKVIHRPERVGYKAGALNEALKYSRGEFILVLDADSVIESSFLKKTIPLLLADKQLGFVQGKVRYINAEQSWLTRALALINDWYAVFSQSALSRCGMIISFIGHGGVFRRKAIEDVGGWLSDTIAEDMDIAYRLQLRGWSAVFVEDAISLEEVPPRYYSAIKRFKRYIRGGIENLIKHGKKVLQCKGLNMLGRFEALIQLSYSLVYLFAFIMVLFTILAYLFIPAGIIDVFWCSPAGFLLSTLLLLTFPYAALVIAPISSAIIVTIAIMFALPFLLKYKNGLRRVDLGRILGTAVLWNDNLLNCLVVIVEMASRKRGEWQPTLRMRSREDKIISLEEKRFNFGLRIASSLILFALFALIAYMNFSFNSIGILVPATLWLASAYLILKY